MLLAPLLLGCWALGKGLDGKLEQSRPSSPASTALVHALTDVKGAMTRAYNLRDSTGISMASLHLLDEGTAEFTYLGVYMAAIMSHHQTNPSWEVRVAGSNDLMQWKFIRTLLPDADMPVPYSLSPGGWILLVHEQWAREGPGGSQAPSRLGFKLYYNVSELLAGRIFSTYTANLSVGAQSGLEGTPNVYDASLVRKGGVFGVNAEIGFHFNDEAGVDQIANGTLRSFGMPDVTPTWDAAVAGGYNQRFKAAGCKGNIGQRQSGQFGNHSVIVQEGNIGHMPPTIWADWRVWLYSLAPEEMLPPTGAGTITALAPQTDGGSTAFGNPAFKLVRCPLRNATALDPFPCLFVTFFIFSEGAAPGEAGVLTFVNKAPLM